MKLYRALESENIHAVLTVNLRNMFSVHLSSRYKLFNRQSPLEVHQLSRVPSCFPRLPCLQEELLSCPRSLTQQIWLLVGYIGFIVDYIGRGHIDEQ